MQIRVLTLLAAAVAVSAIPAAVPATNAVTQSQAPKAHAHAPVSKNNVHMKAVKVTQINVDQCGACLGAVGATISACQPVLSSWSGWFQIPGCIREIVNDFNVLQNDCIPCLQSF